MNGFVDLFIALTNNYMLQFVPQNADLLKIFYYETLNILCVYACAQTFINIMISYIDLFV